MELIFLFFLLAKLCVNQGTRILAEKGHAHHVVIFIRLSQYNMQSTATKQDETGALH